MRIAINVAKWIDRDVLTNGPSTGRPTRLQRYKVLQEALEARGHVCRLAPDFAPGEIDCVLFHDFHAETGDILRLLKQNEGMALLYYASEPPVVSPMNEAKILADVPVDAILTWSDDVVRQIPHARKCNIGQISSDLLLVEPVPFADKRFLTAVYSNKQSGSASALYEERVKAFLFFAEKPEAFDLYGVGWDRSNAEAITRVYRGMCDDKHDVIKNYKFCFAFENMRAPGLVTEKIFDCFYAGTVPIYYGAQNISALIPPSAYIDFANFENYEALYQFMVSMDEGTYQSYLDSAKEFLGSSACRAFTSEGYAERVVACVEELEGAGRPKHSVWGVKWALLKALMACDGFPGSVRSYRRMLFDLCVTW